LPRTFGEPFCPRFTLQSQAGIQAEAGPLNTTLEAIFDVLAPFTRKAAQLDNQANRAALPEMTDLGKVPRLNPIWSNENDRSDSTSPITILGKAGR
jgi:hypothetical protein